MKNLMTAISNYKSTAEDKFLVATLILLQTQAAHASTGGGFSLPGFKQLGCTVLQWLTGELSMYIFFVVVVVTLLVGFFAKMDWSKILGVIVLFGLLKGVVTLFASSGFVRGMDASCIIPA